MKNYMKTLLTLAILLSMIICGYGCNKENPSVSSSNVSASPANPEKAREQLQTIENIKTPDKEDTISSGMTLTGGSVVRKGNEFVFRFDEVPAAANGNMESSGWLSGVLTFNSMQEMIAELICQKPSQETLDLVKHLAARARVKSYKVFDTDHLYEPVLPVSASVDNYIAWSGTNCIQWRFGDDICSGTVLFCEKEGYRDALMNSYIDPWGYYTVSILDEKTIPDRNATETYWVTQKGYYGKTFRYSIELPEKTIFVVEEWVGEQAGQTENLPLRDVELFVMDHGIPFIVTACPTERPSLEWIASFGAKKFTDFGDLPETVTVPVTDAAPETVTKTAKP